MLRPVHCVGYALEGEHFVPCFRAGVESPPALGSERVSALFRSRVAPLPLETRGRRRSDPELSERVAAVVGPRVALVVPLRLGGALGGLLCLGPKQSNDIYTATDVALVASVAHQASAEFPFR